MFDLYSNRSWFREMTLSWGKSLIYPAGIIIGAVLMVLTVSASRDNHWLLLAAFGLGLVAYFVGWISWSIHDRGEFKSTLFAVISAVCWGLVAVSGITLLLVIAALVIKFS